ncbi:hypothetical protein HUT19_34540 [Streptomyces sp. NA02950]|uniref:acyl-CoA dehydrogenase family protein n=1 Tax=Streptomyces sp. NA02950 TaxID=2742137 RepID=UPI00159063D1|nr:acyl-CoA dehydrogenase family protein [Streptomyces sp. NA02950]QKV96210.1 hypothetical protein HUT19_34540 [Streptomyces sp. NA02950]
MSPLDEFDTSLEASVTEVTEAWARPRAGEDLRATDAFQAHWRQAVELGWTGILDGAEDLGSPECRDLLDAACGAVQALARSGFALPLRQTLVSRYAATEELPADVIAVHPTAYGVWHPAADVLISADGAVRTPAVGGRTAGVTDLAGRPCVLSFDNGYRGRRPVVLLAELLLLQEILGAAQGAAAQARRHVTERVQFGRPLIRIPAVRTLTGELDLALRQLETAVHEARRRLGRPNARARDFALLTAREVASRSATEIAAAAHQLHGAMGITEEAGLHWRTKLLWADRDEGVLSRDQGLRALRTDEDELWEWSAPVA